MIANPADSILKSTRNDEEPIKLWGRAEVVEDSNALIPDIRSQPYYAKTARVIRFTVEVWDENCRQYIPDYSADSELMIKLQKSQNKITSLENEIKRLRQLVTTRPEDD